MVSAAVTAVRTGAGPAPQRLALARNYPNPFNPATTIGYLLDQPGAADLAVYDLLGQRLATLAHGAQAAGPHTAVRDGAVTSTGRPAAGGLYLLRLEAGGQVEVRKALLLR